MNARFPRVSFLPASPPAPPVAGGLRALGVWPGGSQTALKRDQRPALRQPQERRAPAELAAGVETAARADSAWC